MAKDATLRALERYPVSVLLWRYSLPAIVGMVAMSLYNIIDAIYIGQWCGAYAITAMALVFPIMNLTIAVATLVGLGSSSAASIALGQKDFNRAFRILGHCIMLGGIFGIIVGWAPLPWLEEILILFGAKGETLQPAYDFMLVMMLAFPLGSSFMNLNHLMRASGYPKKAMMSLLISLVVNVASGPLFIQVFGWGMTGAALATVAGQVAGILWVVRHFMQKSSVLHLKPGIYKLCGPITRRICTVGLPPCLLNIVACVVVVAFNTLLEQYDGQMGVGAYGVVNRVVFLFVMIVLGITQGMQPIAGYNLGLGKFCRVKRVLYLAMLAATCVTTLGFLLVEIFPQAIVGIFVDQKDANSAQLTEIATHGIRLLVLMFPVVGSQIVISNFFQAIGKPVMSIALNLTRQLFFLLPCLALLPTLWGENGIWLSQAVADGLSTALGFTALYLFFKHNFRRNDLSELPAKP